MKVALAVTGCIGAYKAAEILRELQKQGVDVVVVMTKHAQEFIAPLTFEALSGHRVITDMFTPGTNIEIEHIAVAQSIDLLLVAPATANVIGKFCYGIADDFLSTLYLATKAPCLIAPAMNVEMWRHPCVVENVQTLRRRGVFFVEPEEGYLACRMEGPGRLAAIETIVREALGLLRRNRSLSNERILVTAGPTCEDIDPVRFVTNRSTGKMGYAVAEEALRRGATVTLISGPTHLEPPAGVRKIDVRTADQMLQATIDHVNDATIVIKAAAVSDFKPLLVSSTKIKKTGPISEIQLAKTKDILSEIKKVKGDRLVVGFAAETENVIENAKKKLVEKGLDLIVANDVSGSDSGFAVDTNVVTLIDRFGNEESLPKMSKKDVAARVLDRVEKIRKAGANQPSTQGVRETVT